VWFPWPSIVKPTDLYLTATLATRLGGGLPIARTQIGSSFNESGGASPMQELMQPLAKGEHLRLWLGASMLQAGVLPPTAGRLKEQDLSALVAAELAERTADPTPWKITATQQTDRSILWCAAEQSMLSEVQQIVHARGLNLVSVAPVWTLANSKSIATDTEALLWWMEADALTGMLVKNGVVQTLAVSTGVRHAPEDALERLRVRLATGEQTKELMVCISSAAQTIAGQDISAALLPASWQVLRNHAQVSQTSERQAA
jgi:hypothetical protein